MASPYLLRNLLTCKSCLLRHRQPGCLAGLEVQVWNTSCPWPRCSSPFALWGKAESLPECIPHCPKTRTLRLSVFQRGSGCPSSYSPVTGKVGKLLVREKHKQKEQRNSQANRRYNDLGLTWLHVWLEIKIQVHPPKWYASWGWGQEKADCFGLFPSNSFQQIPIAIFLLLLKKLYKKIL